MLQIIKPRNSLNLAQAMAEIERQRVLLNRYRKTLRAIYKSASSSIERHGNKQRTQSTPSQDAVVRAIEKLGGKVESFELAHHLGWTLEYTRVMLGRLWRAQRVTYEPLREPGKGGQPRKLWSVK